MIMMNFDYICSALHNMRIFNLKRYPMKKQKDQMTKQITFRLGSQLMDKLLNYTTTNDVNPAQVIRQLLKAHLN